MNENETEPTPDEIREDETAEETPVEETATSEPEVEEMEEPVVEEPTAETEEDVEEPTAETEEDVEEENIEAAAEAEDEEQPEPQQDDEAEAAPEALPAPEVPVSNKSWYIVKVTSGREESIKAAIERRVKIEGLEEFFGQVYIPVEKIIEVKKVRETKNGEKITKERRVTKEKKKFPGYIMAEVEFNDRILYLFRETAGVGDFVGGSGPLKPPPPMTEIEVRRMRGEEVADEPGKGGKKLKVKLDFEKGDKVRIREGAFANMEGEIKEITDPNETGETPKVTVEVVVIGRPLDVVLDYWQVDKN